jgi:isochorismate synthase
MTEEGQSTGLRAAVAAAISDASSSGRAQVVAHRAQIARRDGLDLFAASQASQKFFWERPDREHAIVGLGVIAEIETEGAKRFERVDTAARELFANIHLAGGDAPPHFGPLLVGGFAFASDREPDSLWRDFPAANFVLPAVAVVRIGDETWCTLARSVDANDDIEPVVSEILIALDQQREEPLAHAANAGAANPRAGTADQATAFSLKNDGTQSTYLGQVSEALAGIHAGDFEKVVLARGLDFESDAPIDAARVLGALRSTYPSCTSFAIARGAAVFLGATPEHLIRLDGKQLETAAVAGSAPRSRDPDEDIRQGRLLLENKKEQVEHAIVVRALREALSDCCSELEIPEAPQLLKVAEIQHLETPIRGVLGDERGILELVGRLHPTPAVGGAPRASAARFIAERERLDRGWYSGPVGFVDSRFGGEFCVALRSALVRQREARLYAGAGIVEGSVATAELRETRLKLHAMLQPLLEV